MEDTPEWSEASSENEDLRPEENSFEENLSQVPSIAGGWLGTYYYRNRSIPPCPFEMTLRDEGNAGRFGGTILDDGPLGEAVIEKGVRDGRYIRFTKLYRQPNAHYGVAPVRYVGMLSEDGRQMSGTWKLISLLGPSGRRVTTTGLWEARRLWSETAEVSSLVDAAGEG